MSSRTPLLPEYHIRSSMLAGEADLTISIGAVAPQQVSASPAAGLCIGLHDVPRCREAASMPSHACVCLHVLHVGQLAQQR